MPAGQYYFPLACSTMLFIETGRSRNYVICTALPPPYKPLSLSVMLHRHLQSWSSILPCSTHTLSPSVFQVVYGCFACFLLLNLPAMHSPEADLTIWRLPAQHFMPDIVHSATPGNTLNFIEAHKIAPHSCTVD